MLFRNLTATTLILLLAGATISTAAPVTVERTAVSSVDAGQASAFALVKSKSAGSSAEGKSNEEALNFASFSPAALLFGGAIGAIFWLGRRRRQESSNWE